MKVWIASHNPGKVAELAMILSNGGIDAAPAPKLAQPMPAEGVASYLDNVRQKARLVSQAMPGEYVLADDSGLTLAACPGQLGIRTARELGKHGGDRLQTVLAMVAGRDRKFTMETWVSLFRDGQEVAVGHGCLTGTLAATPQGDDDRGFDRLLIPAGQDRKSVV